VRTIGTATYHYSEHLRQVDALLDPIRHDRTIDDAERRRLIDEVLAAANARALTLRAARPEPAEAAPVAHEVEARRWQRGLAQVG
jgi:hypothetical protein